MSDFAKAGKFWYKFESLFMCQKMALPNSGNQFLVFVYIFSSLFENILVISSIFFGNSAFSRAYVTYLVQNIFLNYFLFILCQVPYLICLCTPVFKSVAVLVVYIKGVLTLK